MKVIKGIFSFIGVVLFVAVLVVAITIVLNLCGVNVQFLNNASTWICNTAIDGITWVRGLI